jgi:hypothetical protein
MQFVNPVIKDEFESWCQQSVISPLIRAMQGKAVSADHKQPDPMAAAIARVKEEIWSEVVASYLAGANAASRGK